MVFKTQGELMGEYVQDSNHRKMLFLVPFCKKQSFPYNNPVFTEDLLETTFEYTFSSVYQFNEMLSFFYYIVTTKDRKEQAESIVLYDTIQRLQKYARTPLQRQFCLEVLDRILKTENS